MANGQDCGLRAILPVAVAVVETRVDVSEDALWPEERRGLEGVPTPRRLQYATVRHCARQGLALLGLPPSAIPSRPGKAPIWPEGVIGSMTHCHGYRSAAVARAGPLRTIGIDAEPAQALPAKVLARIALPAELATVTELAATDPTTAFDRVLFCAKEAVFKAWYPLTRTGLGFSGAEITLRPAGGLEIIFRCETPVEVRNLTWSGRWGIEGGLTLVGVWASEESPSR